jgi:threonine synthase
MTVAVSKALEERSKAIICASTGNTSASAAAYAGRAALRCIVLVPKARIALGKLAQALFPGAQVIAVDGNFDQALTLVRKIAAEHPITLVNSVNPYRSEGQKTGAFEICDELGEAPDYHAIPVGNAGNITAYWKGYQEYRAKGKSRRLPKMIGFQAAGASPIVQGRVIQNPKTVATAIRIGNPAGWKNAERSRDESGGMITTVTDDEILSASKMLARLEGVFVEPASAASFAGVLKLSRRKYFKRGRVVCVLTGHGLKDPETALKQVKPPRAIKPEYRKIVNEIL